MAWITAPDTRVARSLARSLLRQRLAACVNLLPRVQSHYWWQGRLESAQEVLLICKTTAAQSAALKRAVIQEHPYDTPECIFLPITAGSNAYLDWVRDSVST
jgi:periplasmic divalent cation tolerance protein